jgi:inosose dehydratase
MAQSLRLASAPINWGVSGPDDLGNPTPDEMLAAIAEAGYVGSEMGPFGYFGKSRAEVRTRFEGNNLAVVAIWVDIPLEKPLSTGTADVLEEICSTLGHLDAGHLLVSDFISDERVAVVSRVEESPETWWSENDWAQVKLTLRSIGKIAAKYSITTAVHPHVGGHIESGREIDQLLKAIDNEAIDLCIDTGHIRLGGTDAIPILKQEARRVSHIHAKDVDPEILERMQHGEIGYFDAVGQGLYCDLGAGMVDWRGFQQALSDSNYPGWVVAEQDRLLVPGSSEPFESNQRNFAFLQDLLGVS